MSAPLRASFCAASIAIVLAPGQPALAQGTADPDPGGQTSARPLEARPRTLFVHLLGDAVGDLKRLPSAETVAWLSVGAAASAASHVADDSVLRSLSGSVPLGAALDAGSTLGGAPVQVGASLATYLIGRARGNARVAEVGGDLIRAQMISQIMTSSIKLSVRRTRPDGGSFSFPSGHTSVTFASATVLHRDLGWKVGVPAYGLATYVAASRVQEKRHFLSDVVFGVAIGLVAGRTVTIGRDARRFAVAPAMAPGGGVVVFTWVGHR